MLPALSAGTPGYASLPLVGRDRAWDSLRAAVAAAMVGRGGLALIAGEAGIGKTALAEAIAADAAGQGALVLVGCCHDLAETPPYGPWIELFASPSGPVPASPP